MREFIDSTNIYYLPQIINSLGGETDTVVCWSQLKLASNGFREPILYVALQSSFSDTELAA